MPILKNSRHEKFAQLIASGTSQAAAYEAAGYCPKSQNALYADSSALVRIPKVAERIAELKERTETKSAISRDEVVAILAEYARIYPGPKYPHDIRLRAIAQLAKMCGWDSAEKLEHSANESLIQALKRLRGS